MDCRVGKLHQEYAMAMEFSRVEQWNSAEPSKLHPHFPKMKGTN
jgi:hypothetical protein